MSSVLNSFAQMAKGWVEFPNLFGDKGLRIPIDDTAFKIGSFEVKWYGLIICLAVVLCIVLGLKSCNKHGLTQDDVLDYILFAIPSAMIGARLYYVIFQWENYAEDPYLQKGSGIQPILLPFGQNCLKLNSYIKTAFRFNYGDCHFSAQ